MGAQLLECNKVSEGQALQGCLASVHLHSAHKRSVGSVGVEWGTWKQPTLWKVELRRSQGGAVLSADRHSGSGLHSSSLKGNPLPPELPGSASSRDGPGLVTGQGCAAHGKVVEVSRGSHLIIRPTLGV